MSGETKTPSIAETLLLALDAARRTMDQELVTEAYEAICRYEWGYAPHFDVWDAWERETREAMELPLRDDVCYRDHAPGVDGEPWRNPMGND